MVGAVSSIRIRRPGRDAGVPVRSPRRTSAPRAKLPLSIHVRSGPFSSCLCCPVGRGTASHGTRPTSPRSRTRLLCFPRPFFSSWGNCRPGLPYFHSIPEVPERVLAPNSFKRLHIHAVPSSSMPARPSLDTSPDDPHALLRAACLVSGARQLVLYPTPW